MHYNETQVQKQRPATGVIHNTFPDNIIGFPRTIIPFLATYNKHEALS